MQGWGIMFSVCLCILVIMVICCIMDTGTQLYTCVNNFDNNRCSCTREVYLSCCICLWYQHIRTVTYTHKNVGVHMCRGEMGVGVVVVCGVVLRWSVYRCIGWGECGDVVLRDLIYIMCYGNLPKISRRWYKNQETT